jgi:hypothetical protein
MWKAKKIKTKCGLFAERGRRQRALCQVLLANTLDNFGKNFPRSGVPSFVERSCTGRSAKNFFKKIKNRHCGRPLRGALGTGFKKQKNRLCRRPLPGALGIGFSKKNKPPSLPRPLANKISKTVNLTPPVNGFFWPTAHRGLSAQPVPRAWCLGAGQRIVVEKKFPVGPLLSATLGKGVAECLMPFAESFMPSAKAGFLVVNGPFDKVLLQ